MEPTIQEVPAISIHSARNWHAQPREDIISITGPGEPRAWLKKGWAHVLRLVFDDGEVPFFNRRIFTEEDADKVIDFLDKIEERSTTSSSIAPAVRAGLPQSRDTSASGTTSRTGSATIACSKDTYSRPCSGDGGTVSRREKGAVATRDPAPRPQGLLDGADRLRASTLSAAKEFYRGIGGGHHAF